MEAGSDGDEDEYEGDEDDNFSKSNCFFILRFMPDIVQLLRSTKRSMTMTMISKDPRRIMMLVYMSVGQHMTMLRGIVRKTKS